MVSGVEFLRCLQKTGVKNEKKPKILENKCQGSSQRKLDHRDRGNAGLYGGELSGKCPFAGAFSGKFYAGDRAGQIFVFVVSLIAMVFGTGYSYMMLNMSRGREFSLGNLLYMFHNQPDRVLIAAFVMALLNTVSQLPIYFAVYLTDPGSTIEAQMNWMQMIMGIMILSVVLNVLITVPLALSFYLLADNPEMGGVESLKQSMRLMKGHIWQYLMLQLSFAPLLIVSLLFMGIPLLWVLPYMEASETAFYRDILGEFDEPEKKEESFYKNTASDDYNAEA